MSSIIDRSIFSQCLVVCFILWGCSGESANVGEQFEVDGGIDQTVTADISLTEDQAVPPLDGIRGA